MLHELFIKASDFFHIRMSVDSHRLLSPTYFLSLSRSISLQYFKHTLHSQTLLPLSISFLTFALVAMQTQSKVYLKTTQDLCLIASPRSSKYVVEPCLLLAFEAYPIRLQESKKHKHDGRVSGVILKHHQCRVHFHSQNRRPWNAPRGRMSNHSHTTLVVMWWFKDPKFFWKQSAYTCL